MLGLPSAVTVIKDVDDASAVAAAEKTQTSLPAPLITHTAATPQDSPKDVDSDHTNNSERSSSLQLPYGSAVIRPTASSFWLFLQCLL